MFFLFKTCWDTRYRLIYHMERMALMHRLQVQSMESQKEAVRHGFEATSGNLPVVDEAADLSED